MILFLYLHDCCKEVESTLNYIKKGLGSVPVVVEEFKWNCVGPGPDDQSVKSSLREIFDFEDLEDSKVEKIDNNTLQVTTPHKVFVLIKLDLKRKKAVATLHKYKRKKDYEYEVYERGSDLSICTRTTAQELGNEKITELPVYRLISDLTKSDDGEAEHTLKNLTEDDKFMNLVDNMHDTFNKGYNRLTRLRRG